MKCQECDFETENERSLGQHERGCTPERRDRDRRIVDALRAGGATNGEVAERFGVSTATLERVKCAAGLTGTRAPVRRAKRAAAPKRRTESKVVRLPGWRLYDGFAPAGSFGAGKCVQPRCGYEAPTAGLLLCHCETEHGIHAYTPAMVGAQLLTRLDERLGRTRKRTRRPESGHAWRATAAVT